MRQGRGSQGRWALRALAVTPPQPQLHGGHGREERAAAIPCRGEDRLQPGTPVAAGDPRCHGHTGLGFSFHLPRNLNQHLSPLFRGLPLQQAARPALTLPRGSWGHGRPSKVSSTRHPGPAPEDSVFLLTLTVGRQDTRAAVALAHTRATTEINMGRGWHRPGPSTGPEPVASPSAAALLAQGMSAGYGDGGFPLELPKTAMACDSAGRGAGSDLECLWWGAARGARARAGASTRPGPLAAAPPARRPLVGQSPPLWHRGH